MKQLFSIFFIIVIAAATILPVQAKDTRTCTKTSAQEIAALFDRWNASLATLDPDKMAALYTPEAVLLPTLSNKPRTNHEEIRDYFVHFIEKKPQGTIDFRIIKIGCDSASDTGLYTFTLHDTKGKPKKVSARYSYVYEYLDGATRDRQAPVDFAGSLDERIQFAWQTHGVILPGGGATRYDPPLTPSKRQLGAIPSGGGKFSGNPLPGRGAGVGGTDRDVLTTHPCPATTAGHPLRGRGILW